VVVRPSESLGRLAADFVRSADFRARVHGPLGRMFSRLAEGETEHEGDLLSHLLFDGRFAAALIALGREDARARADELCRLLDPTAPTRARQTSRRAVG
jgi:NTE family protein